MKVEDFKLDQKYFISKATFQPLKHLSDSLCYIPFCI